MAMTADSSPNHHSPRGGRKGHRSQWAQVFLDQSPATADPPPASPSPPLPAEDVTASPEPEGDSINAAPAQPKKQAWSKPPPNDGVEAAVSNARQLISDPLSWPELSMAAKRVPKLSSANSSSSTPKTVAEGSGSNSQAAPTAPVVRNTPNRHSHSNPSSTPHGPAPARQRPNKHRGGGSGNFHHPPPPVQPMTPPPPPPLQPISANPPPFPVIPGPLPHNAYLNMLPPMMNPAIREPRAGWDGRPVGGFPSQPRPVNDHWNSSWRSSFWPNGHGEGQRDRGNYGSDRDVIVQSHRANPRSYMRTPPPSPSPPPYLPAAPGRPYLQTMYPDVGHLYYSPVPVDPYRAGMIYPNGPPFSVFIPTSESLHVSLVRQIEYYFSDDNLAKDEFLKSKMDNEGWVSISWIADFPRVQSMTGGDHQMILNCLKASTLVEVQDERMRRRNGWMKWVRAPAQLSSRGDSSTSAGLSLHSLAASIQNMSVAEAAANTSSASLPEHPDGQSTGHS